jgi:hypothetical protein
MLKDEIKKLKRVKKPPESTDQNHNLGHETNIIS